MAAEDIQAQALGWALGETAKQCFGEDYGLAVTWGPQPMQTPQGTAVIPGWFLLIVARNPILGEEPLYHMVPLGAPRPLEAEVRKQVGEGIRMLRDLSRSKLAGMNGKAPAKAVSG